MTKNQNRYDALLHERALALVSYQSAFKHKLELDGSELGFDGWSLASVERRRKDKYIEVGRTLHLFER